MLSGWESFINAFAMLGLGLAFGFKHATEVDHIGGSFHDCQRASERVALDRHWCLVGGGHTAALVSVGLVVLVLRVAIPGLVASWLEFGVALMIVGLGAALLVRSLRKRRTFHLHRHSHDGISHVHIHFHDENTKHTHIFCHAFAPSINHWLTTAVSRRDARFRYAYETTFVSGLWRSIL